MKTSKTESSSENQTEMYPYGDPITFFDGEGFPDLSEVPNSDDIWNAHITQSQKLGHIRIVGLTSPLIDLEKGNVAILIFSDTTLSDLKQDWYKVQEYRDKLSAIQGDLKNCLLYYSQTMYRLSRNFRMSYAGIAKFLNFEILAIICADLQLSEKEFVTLQYGYMPIARNHLLSLGMTEKEMSDWINHAIHELKKGDPPWIFDGGPFNRQNVRECVRGFQKILSEKNLVLNKKKDMIGLYAYLLPNARKYLIDLYLKHSKDIDKSRRQFAEWECLFYRMVREIQANQRSYFPNPAAVGELDRIFP